MRSKRQTTMAKLQRERRVEEKRTLKREAKQAAAAARKAGSSRRRNPGSSRSKNRLAWTRNRASAVALVRFPARS